MKRLLLLLPLLLAGCATAPPAIEGARGFFGGLLDGALAPISFVISIFSETVAVYGVPSSGVWYDLGFLIGLTCWAGGGAAASSRKD